MKILLVIISLFTFHSLKATSFRGLGYELYKKVEMEHFGNRRGNLIDEDIETINAYYEMVFKKEKFDNNDKESLIRFLTIILRMLETDRIPKNQLGKIRKMFVALDKFDFFYPISRYRGNNIMWLLELRNIDNKNEKIKFLKSSLSDFSNNKKVLQILIKDSMYQQIQQWFDKSKIKNYEQTIEVLKRQNRILISIENKNDNLKKLLIDDYKQMIVQIFNSYKEIEDIALLSNEELSNYKRNKNIFRDTLYKHNNWLFFLFARHKYFPEVKEILTNIDTDWLYYNDYKIINLLPKNSQKKIFSTINNKLNIFKKLLLINKKYIDPIFELPSYRPLHIKNQAFLKKYTRE